MSAATHLRILDSHGQKIPFAAFAGDYEGAATGRRMSTWGISASGPNASLYGSLSAMRSRARQLIRNNPLIAGAVQDLAADIIGSGIAPRWLMADRDMKQLIQDRWLLSAEEWDFMGVTDVYGQQTVIVDGLIDAGEVLINILPQPRDAGLAVPIQFQVLEADHLDETYNIIAPNGNEVRMGIEIDRRGRRVAYWVWKEHPGESYLTARNAGERVRIPAYGAPDAAGGGMLHIFKPIRPGQMRGRPWLAAIIVKMHDLDQYDDAELVRKKGAALIGGYISEPAGKNIDPADYFGRRAAADSEGRDVLAIEPGTFPVLPYGMEPHFLTPPDVGTSFDPWKKDQYRQVAKGTGVTYEMLTGDLSNVNYSSIRAGLLAHRRRIKALIYQVIVHQACRPMNWAWLDAAVLSGALPVSTREYLANVREFRRIEHRHDGWPWTDPVKDQVGAQMMRRNGFASRAQLVAEIGNDIDVVDREIMEENDRADENGLVYDTDSRKTAQSGVMQKAQEATVEP